MPELFRFESERGWLGIPARPRIVARRLWSGAMWIAALCMVLLAAPPAQADSPLRDDASATKTKPDDDAFAWARLRVVPEPTIIAGERSTVSVELRNTGSLTWNSESNHDFISYQLWSGDGHQLLRDGARTRLPHAVLPGQTVTVALEFVAPATPGDVWIDVLPVREHVRWYPEPQRDATGRVEVEVEVADLAWDLEHDTTPKTIPIDGHALVSLTVHNIGFDTWGERDFLSYHWLTPSGEVVAEGPRTPFPEPVPRGHAITVKARVDPPPNRGDYILRWQPVREHVKWFGPPPGHASPRVPVTIVPPELAWRMVEIDPMPAVWVNQTLRVDVTLENLGTATWSEQRGDHLSYHWLDADGRMVQIDGRRTSYDKAVAPGETVTVSALVAGPPVAGDYKLQWEPVREHVRWYGPPVTGPRTLIIATRRLSTWLQLGLGALGLLAAVALRRFPALRSRARLGDDAILVWTWAALTLISVTFSELASLEMWRRALLYAMSGAAGLVLPLLLLRGRARMIAAAVMLIAANALAFSDLVYMHFFGAIVPFAALTAAHQASELGASIAELVEPSYAWLLPVPVAASIMAIVWPRRSPPQPAPPRPTSRRFAVDPRWLLPVVCVVATFPVAERLHRAMGGKLGKRVYSEARNVSRLGVLNAHVFDVVRTASEATTRDELPEEEIAAVDAYYTARAAQVAATPQTDYGLARGANLLLIQVEAAQGFVVDTEIAGQPIAPFMRSLVERGYAYPNIFDQTNHGKTSDSEYLTLTSNHPLKSGALAFLRANNEFVTIAHVLREHGYHTLSAHPYKRGFWNRAVLHPRYGFDRSLFRRELGPGQDVGWGLADGLFFERIMPELEHLERPFFAFLVTLSLHHPYDSFPDNLRELDLGHLEGTNLGNYLHGMNYFDRSLEQLFRRLATSGLLDDTIVALYGDHDSRLPYDAELREVVGVDRWSPSLEQRLERIPLFVILPGEERRGVVETTGGQLDIGPTLLHFLGVPRPKSYLGQPLLPGITGRVAAYPDGSAFGDDRMFVATGRDIPNRGGCFDLPSGASRAFADCKDIRQFARSELAFSRRVLDHDLQRHLTPISDAAARVVAGAN